MAYRHAFPSGEEFNGKHVFTLPDILLICAGIYSLVLDRITMNMIARNSKAICFVNVFSSTVVLAILWLLSLLTGPSRPSLFFGEFFIVEKHFGVP